MPRSESGESLKPSSAPSVLVVTGSSAGGVDALTAFVAHLPDALSLPIIVAQHLSPTHTSHLAAILSQQTSFAVKEVAGESTLEGGTIYIVPPNCDVEVRDGDVTIVSSSATGPHPSIDRLFASAAKIYGERLIAIILSGLGSDGARGARAVKNEGGTVIVQQPESAGYASMPLSIPPTLVDITAAPEAMGKLILNMLGASSLPDDASDKNMLRTLLALLRERSGIDFSQYKTPTIMRRLSRLMAASGVTSISDYITFLQHNPEGYQRLVNSFLIKVTEFFRDAALFEQLRAHVLPKLMVEARERSRELRIWSAGTSTGEEAYSLAILCAELMREGAGPTNVRIFATDVDEQAIAFARRGVYSADALRDVPPTLAERYFVQTDDRFEVSKQIRNMTVFGQHDLGQRAPFPRIDLVLCRNVLIYFTKDLQTRALQLFAFALRDGGYLVLGKAESTTPLPQFFKLSNSLLKIYERDGERVMLPPTRMKDSAPSAPLPTFLGSAPARDTRIIMHNSSEGARLPSQDALSTYNSASVVGMVVVDKNYDIVAINSAARAMLQIHGVGVGSDLIHLLPAIGTELRPIIDAALIGESVEPTVCIAKDPVSGIDRWLQVHCSTQRPPGAGTGDTAGLVIVDVTRYERKILESDALAVQLRAEAQEHAARAEELSARVRSMLAANEELTAINLELRTYNEQLLINAEEAASSNEEIETLNEEMQATNEELETLNEELQATVEELNTTNDELEARSSELEAANFEKQAQIELVRRSRQMVTLALKSAAPPCAIVDARGQIEYIAPEVSELASSDAAAWWRESGYVTLSDGTRYRSQVQPLADGSVLVTFESG